MVVSDETKKVINRFGIKKGNTSRDMTHMELVNSRMRDISYKKYQNKQKSNRDEKDRLFALLPKIPQGFYEWAKCMLYGNEKFLVYKRETKYRVLISCCNCGTTYTDRTNSISPNVQSIKTPRDGEIGKCRWCDNRGKYKPKGRFKPQMEIKMCYLFQNLSDGGVVIRYFCVYLNQYYEGHNISFVERARIFLNINKKPRLYWNYSWDNDSNKHFSSYNESGAGNYNLTDAHIYPGYMEVLKASSLKHGDFRNYAYTTTYVNCRPGNEDYIEALATYAYYPQIEYLYKAGLEKVVRRLVRFHGVDGTINKKGKNLAGILKIKTNRLELIKKEKGDLTLLQVLQLEKRHDFKLTDAQIEWLKGHITRYGFKKELSLILKYMSLTKVINRVNEYKDKEYEGKEYSAWTEFKDYIGMREELGYDMTNTVYLHPHSLKEAHAAMVEEKEKKQNSEYIAQMMERYSNIPQHFKKLQKKYGMESNGYIFIPAHDAKEIILEGRTLHHCVGRETYLSKHNRGESSIIFMRDIKTPDVPYVTIEVKGEKIIQWYGAHDIKPKDDRTKSAIAEFEKHIKKKTAKRQQEELAPAV